MPFCSHSLPLPSLNHRCSTRRPVSVSRSRAVASAGFWQRSRGRNVCLVGNGSNPSIDTAPDGLVKKRSIVEHIFLLSAKAELSEDEEKDMLDHLYTSQYQMSGIIAISLGRIADTNVDNFTHAVYMRFQKREDVTKFYVNSYYTGILKGHVTPYCYGSISVDYESEVEDDILSIFRRGEVPISTLEIASTHMLQLYAFLLLRPFRYSERARNTRICGG